MTENSGGVEAFLMNNFRAIDRTAMQWDFLCNSHEPIAYEEEILTVTEARISLLGGYALRDPHPIETYFANQLNCPCFVTADTA